VGAIGFVFSAAAVGPGAPLLAAPCFGSNDGARRNQNENLSKGLLTAADLMAASPVDPNSTAIIHPAHILASTGDGVGWGTMKGRGTNDPDAISNCVANLSDRWMLYVDGRTFGRYFCRQGYGTEPNSIASQDIEIRHTSCNGSTRWAFFWNGTLKTCQAINSSAGTPHAGGESVGANPQHINIRYRQLRYRVLGGSWTPWTSGQGACVSAGYGFTIYAFDDFMPKEL
jgi:hypothetical protein